MVLHIYHAKILSNHYNDIYIPPEITKYCVFSSHIFLLIGLFSLKNQCPTKQIAGLLLLILYLSSIAFWSRLYVVSFIRVIDQYIVAVIILYLSFIVFNGNSVSKKLVFITALTVIGSIFYYNEKVYNDEVEIPIFFDKYHALCKLNISKETFDSVMAYLRLESVVRIGGNGCYTYTGFRNESQKNEAQYRFVFIHSVCVHLGFALTVLLTI